MRTSVEKTGLLDFFWENRQRLNQGLHFDGKTYELEARGLIQRVSGGWARLTDSGRAFLNKLEAIKLRSEKNESSPRDS
jgi:hypothetical protein